MKTFSVLVKLSSHLNKYLLYSNISRRIFMWINISALTRRWLKSLLFHIYEEFVPFAYVCRLYLSPSCVIFFNQNQILTFFTTIRHFYFLYSCQWLYLQHQAKDYLYKGVTKQQGDLKSGLDKNTDDVKPYKNFSLNKRLRTESTCCNIPSTCALFDTK